MLTNNFASLLSMAVGTSNSNLPVCKSTQNESVSPNRSWLATLLQYSLPIINNGGNPQRGHWMVFGSGTTPAKSTDITIETPVESFDVISQTSNIPYKYSSTTMTITRVIQNTSTEPLIISEVGLYADNSGGTVLMLAHEVIEPITLQPGEKHSFTMDLCVE